jgi:hypothetical protein
MKVNSSCVVVVALALLSPQSAHAQAGSSHPQLERIFVTHAGSGEELRGCLLNIGPETLSMLVDNRRVDLPLTDVLRIDRRGDSLKNGALIGAGVFAALCALGCYAGTRNAGEATAALVIDTALGAAIGASIDAMHSGRTAIYRKGAESTARQIGVALRVRF